MEKTKKPFYKKGWVIILFIFLGIGMLMGFIEQLTGKELVRVEEPKIVQELQQKKDCKSDGDCFQTALKNCDRVKAILPHPMGDRIWEITGYKGDSCKVHYTVETFMTIEKDCYIKKDTILKGNNKMGKVADIISHLEECSDEIRS